MGGVPKLVVPLNYTIFNSIFHYKPSISETSISQISRSCPAFGGTHNDMRSEPGANQANCPRDVVEILVQHVGKPAESCEDDDI